MTISCEPIEEWRARPTSRRSAEIARLLGFGGALGDDVELFSAVQMTARRRRRSSERPALRVGDLVRGRDDGRPALVTYGGRVGLVTMICDDIYAFAFAFAPDSCGLFFRARLLKLASTL